MLTISKRKVGKAKAVIGQKPDPAGLLSIA